MTETEAAVPVAGLSRRSLVVGAVWSLPVIAAAVATPLTAASVACTAAVSTSTAAYSRLSATSSVFTWADLFGDGNDLTLTLTAVPNGATNMTINQVNNLVLDSTQQGGEAQPSVRLSLDTADLRNIGGGERVTFSFALGGVPTTVENLNYKIKDIDGNQALDGLGGAERVYVSEGSGTYDPSWVSGQGIGADAWRPFTGAPTVEVTPGSASGNIDVTVDAVGAFDLTFVANNSGRALGERPNQNIWIGPLSFTALNPACVL